MVGDGGTRGRGVGGKSRDENGGRRRSSGAGLGVLGLVWREVPRRPTQRSGVSRRGKIEPSGPKFLPDRRHSDRSEPASGHKHREALPTGRGSGRGADGASCVETRAIDPSGRDAMLQPRVPLIGITQHAESGGSLGLSTP